MRWGRIACAIAIGGAIACGTLEGSSSSADPDAGSPDATVVIVEHEASMTPSPPSDGGVVFTDVPPGDPDFAALMAILDVIDGCTPTTFCPDAMIKRRDVFRWAVRLRVGDAFPYPGTPVSFDDVPASDPDFPYVQKAKEIGLTSGCNPTGFCPELTVPRSQLAVLLDVLVHRGEHDASAPARFLDEGEAGGLAAFIRAIQDDGLLDPCRADDAGEYFCPLDQATRRQSGVALARARPKLPPL